MIHLEADELGTLCICSIRHCIGKQTYIPDTVQKICIQHISQFADNDIDIMLKDCMLVERYDLYGDALNKPGWTNLKNVLVSEKERRERET